MTRYSVHYTGHVQGVGFRATAAHLARQFQVVGYVQNLADGRVRLIAEGQGEHLDAFLYAIDDRMSSYIQEHTVDKATATGEFGNLASAGTFTVRH